MNEQDKESIIARIKKMEQYFDEIIAAKKARSDSFLDDPVIKAHFCELLDYYENGQWLEDYERDERGEIPAELKRGVLSQDALYDFLSELECENQ